MFDDKPMPVIAPDDVMPPSLVGCGPVSHVGVAKADVLKAVAPVQGAIQKLADDDDVGRSPNVGDWQ